VHPISFQYVVLYFVIFPYRDIMKDACRIVLDLIYFVCYWMILLCHALQYIIGHALARSNSDGAVPNNNS
jgi:hypothetical protein